MTRSLADWLAYQESTHPRSIELGLDRMRAVAQRLGLPAAGIRTVTVGGTNGKGSTTTLLAGIYRAAGYAVGAYTSPHLFRYQERVAVDGVPASAEALCAAFESIEAARGAVPLTYFEFGTLAALLVFARAKVDVQVLEVGLGGRLDAVNLVDADAAIVTSLGLDHQDWLGDTLDAIGREKAGIYRRGRHAVYAGTTANAGLVAAAEAIGAAVQRRDAGDFGWERQGRGWRWWLRGRADAVAGGDATLDHLPLPALAGEHQLDNAAGALVVVAALQTVLPVPRAAIDSALVQLALPGRMQRQGRFLLDVAHNAEAALALAAHFAESAMDIASTGDGRSVEDPGSRAVLITGMLRDKPARAIAAALALQVGEAFAFTLPPPRGFTADELAAELVAGGLPTTACASPEAALVAALAAAGENRRLIVCGSFLAVAAIAPLLPD